MSVVTSRSRVYQFILRLYKTPDEILGGFDLPCCAVGYSPTLGLRATPLGAFCVANRVVIADTSRRSPSFEYRLVKYGGKGFDVVLPSLSPEYEPPNAWEVNDEEEEEEGPKPDHDEEDEDGDGDDDDDGGKKSARKRIVWKDQPCRLGIVQGGEIWRFHSHSPVELTASDYGMDALAEGGHPIMVGRRNFKQALFGGPGQLVLACDTWADLFEPQGAQVVGSPYVEEVMAWRFDFVKKSLSLRGTTHQERDDPEEAFDSWVRRRFKAWFQDEAPRIAKARNNPKAIDKIEKEYVERITKAFRAAEKPIEWLTKNPGSQHTASFHPVEEHASVWYTKQCYVPTPIFLPRDVAWWVSLLLLRRVPQSDLRRLLVWRYIIPAWARTLIPHNVVFVEH